MNYNYDDYNYDPCHHENMPQKRKRRFPVSQKLIELSFSTNYDKNEFKSARAGDKTANKSLEDNDDHDVYWRISRFFIDHPTTGKMFNSKFI